jgi:hypothetical protein
MKPANRTLVARAAALTLAASLSAQPALAVCFISCRPTDQNARVVLDNLITSRFHAPYMILSYETTRTADFDLIAGEMRGFEIFFKATVEFPQGANLDCAPNAAPRRAEDCSDDPYFSLIRETRPQPGRQFVEPGGKRSFDEDFRFAELKTGWKGPDNKIYKPE